MNRRAFLGLFTGVTVGLAGCTAGGVRPPVAGFPPPKNPDKIVEQGFPVTVCEKSPSPYDAIHAILKPATDSDWDGLTVREQYRFGADDGPGLSEDAYVVGIERGGEARAYPLSILWWHEVVNDTLGGEPVLVTYCPMCETGMVATRRAGGEETMFRGSGQLWQAPAAYGFASAQEGRVFGVSVLSGETAVRNAANLVLYDEGTGSYWSQMLAKAICGSQSGEQMRILPSTVTTWGEWHTEYPETDVLLPPPWSKTA
jgi:hypothetical protein